MKFETIPFLGDFIDGQFIKPAQSNGAIERRDPGNTKSLVFDGTFAFDQVNLACEAARKAFRPWADLSMDDRKNYLLRLKEAYLSHSDTLAATISREVGKPLWEAKQEVQTMVNKIDVTINDALDLVSEKKIDKASGSTPGFLRFKPRGVMAVIGPFNFPGHLPNGHIIPSLLMGNTVVFKPSELTPATGQKMAEIFEAAQFPHGVFNVLQGNGELGKRLVMHELVEGVLFTGSYETGYRIKQDILPHFWKICALEMGGKNAAIVWDDCDLKKAVYENIISAFVTTGQRCSATSRIIVRRSFVDKFINTFHEAAKKVSINYAFENPFMGPLINNESLDKYIRFQGIASREGAESIMRGKVLELATEGYYVTPSINLVNKVDPKSIYQKTEVFGPNVAIYLVDEIAEAVNIVNSSSYGLVLSVFSSDREIFDYSFRHSRVGLVNFNRGTVGASSRLPFGGMGKSGNNQPAGTFAIYSCSYPVASLEDDSAVDEKKAPPGMNFDDAIFSAKNVGGNLLSKAVGLRTLGLDFGDKRIGVAISDEMGWTAQGVKHIERQSIEKDLNEIDAIMKEYGNVENIVVGMPFNMDGSEGERVELTRKFITHLEGRFNIPIVEIDERWSSMEAEKFLISADVSRKKRKGKVDQLAASFILQTYLEQKRK